MNIKKSHLATKVKSYMPTSGYPQYQDPQTGEICFLPSLFPHARSFGGYSKTEIENWVNSGNMPRELYESSLESEKN